MSYRIRVAPEVKRWLAELRTADPGAADLVDAALVALRDRGSGMGPPLVVPVETPSRDARPDLDYAYQRQLEMLTRVRRAVADLATARKRLELQVQQLEEVVSKLEEQRGRAAETDELAAQASDRQAVMAAQLADLRRQLESVRSEEERLNAASRRLELKVNNFRIQKEAIKAADAAADATDVVEQAEAELDATGANGQHPPGVGQAPDLSPVRPVRPVRQVKPLPLSELRPGAPEMDDIRILFTVEPSRVVAQSAATAVILAAGTERDWLRAWYTESVLRARSRYERDRGDRS